MEIYIKNMVCPRCIWVVKEIFKEQGLSISHIQLGKVVTAEDLTPDDLGELGIRLSQQGFELLNNTQRQIVEQIKSTIIEHIYSKGNQEVNYSDLLVRKLNRDYSFLSKLFSATEGITIEQFTILQKVERIKELLSYDQLNLSEIAFRLGYSSVAHLSSQFKRITGMTPSTFKNQSLESRKSIDNLR